MKKIFLFYFLFFYFFVFLNFVVPQNYLSGIERTKLNSTKKEKKREITTITLLFSNTIKEIKRENIYPKDILNYLTLSIKENNIIITYKNSPSLLLQNKTLTFCEAVIDSDNRAIKEFSIDL